MALNERIVNGNGLFCITIIVAFAVAEFKGVADTLQENKVLLLFTLPKLLSVSTYRPSEPPTKNSSLDFDIFIQTLLIIFLALEYSHLLYLKFPVQK